MIFLYEFENNISIAFYICWGNKYTDKHIIALLRATSRFSHYIFLVQLLQAHFQYGVTDTFHKAGLSKCRR